MRSGSETRSLAACCHPGPAASSRSLPASMRLPRHAGAAIALAALYLLSAPALAGAQEISACAAEEYRPAEQPPFGGAPVAPLEPVSVARSGDVEVRTYARGDCLLQVSYFERRRGGRPEAGRCGDGHRARSLERPPARRRARARLRGRRRPGGQLALGLDPALPHLPRPLHRPPPPLAAAPPRPARPRRSQRLAPLLQPGRDRGIRGAHLSRPRLRAPADALRRLPARATGGPALLGARALARDRGGPARWGADRAQRRRLARDRRRGRRRDRRRPHHQRRGAIRRRVLAGHRPPRRRLRPRELPRVRALRGRVSVGGGVGRRPGRARRGDLLRPAGGGRAGAARPSPARRRGRAGARRRACVRLARLPVDAVRDERERERRARRGQRGLGARRPPLGARARRGAGGGGRSEVRDRRAGTPVRYRRRPCATAAAS